MEEKKKKIGKSQKIALFVVFVLFYLQRMTQLSKSWPTDPLGNNVESIFCAGTITFIGLIGIFIFNKLKKS